MNLMNFDIDAFLRDYWQQKPLLIKNPWDGWSDPLEPDDLAGLACEQGVESRLITQTGDDPDLPWELEHGPFAESRFSQLDHKRWTLLVQAVDHYVPDVAAMIEPFRFIPNWRIDDVMVSYAADGGGVGPHFDQYDVFLIQGSGRRQWQVGGHCDENSELLPHNDLRLLADFDATDEWTCEPGDILYVPPGIAHNGIAVGDDCMTYSIGFRAPSRSELIGYWADDLLADMQDDDRYSDPKLKALKNPGEIPTDALDRLHAMITEKLNDREAFAMWFGQYSSTPKYPDVDWRPEEPLGMDQLQQYLARETPIYRNPSSRFSFIREPSQIQLFVDGNSFPCTGESAKFAEALCAKNIVHMEQNYLQSDTVMALISKLYNLGSVTFDQPETE